MQQGNTKERIVEAYIELESERPVEKITVTALVERSRITRKTFYYYFKDIYDLMEYRMEREMKRIMEETMSQPDPEKALTQLYMYIMENQKHIRALSESVQFMALRRQMGEKVYQYFYNHLERIGMFKNLTMPEAAMAVHTSPICWASSRVGLRMTAWGFRLAGSTLDRMGMPNATVLPVPVGALAIISWPSSISGMAFSWISVISVKPMACVACRISGATRVSSVNCMFVLPFVCFTLIFYYNRLCNAPQDGDTQKGLRREQCHSVKQTNPSIPTQEVV